MRIESIAREYSTEREMACITAPPITEEVFNKAMELRSSLDALAVIQFRLQQGFLYIQAPSWSSQVRENIERLLAKAENALDEIQKSKADKARLENQKKNQAIDAAAMGLGVTVK